MAGFCHMDRSLFLCRSLKEITGREVCCYSISAKEQRNIDITMEWLMKHSKPPKS